MEEEDDKRESVDNNFAAKEQQWVVLDSLFDELFSQGASSASDLYKKPFYKALRHNLKLENNICYDILNPFTIRDEGPLEKAIKKVNQKFSKSFVLWKSRKLMRIMSDYRLANIHSRVQDSQLDLLQFLSKHNDEIFNQLILEYVCFTKRLIPCLETLKKYSYSCSVTAIKLEGYIPKPVILSESLQDQVYIFKDISHCEDVLFMCLNILIDFPDSIFSTSFHETRNQLHRYMIKCISISSGMLTCTAIRVLTNCIDRDLPEDFDWKSLINVVKIVVARCLSAENMDIFQYFSIFLNKIFSLHDAMEAEDKLEIFSAVLPATPYFPGRVSSDTFDKFISLMDYRIVNRDTEIKIIELSKSLLAYPFLMKIMEKYLILTLAYAKDDKGVKRKRDQNWPNFEPVLFLKTSAVWKNILNNLKLILSYSYDPSKLEDVVHFVNNAVCAFVELKKVLPPLSENSDFLNSFVPSILSFLFLLLSQQTLPSEAPEICVNCIKMCYELLALNSDSLLEAINALLLVADKMEQNTKLLRLVLSGMTEIYISFWKSKQCSDSNLAIVANIILCFGAKHELFLSSINELMSLILCSGSEDSEKLFSYLKYLLNEERLNFFLMNNSWGNKIICFLSNNCLLKKANGSWKILCRYCDLKKPKLCNPDENSDFGGEELLAVVGLKFVDIFRTSEEQEKYFLVKHHLLRYLNHSNIIRSPPIFKSIIRLLLSLNPKLLNACPNLWHYIYFQENRLVVESLEMFLQVLLGEVKTSIFNWHCGSKNVCSLYNIFYITLEISLVPNTHFILPFWKIVLIFILCPQIFGKFRLSSALKHTANCNSFTVKSLFARYPEDLSVTLGNIFYISYILNKMEEKKVVELLGELLEGQFIRYLVNSSMISHLLLNYTKEKALPILHHLGEAFRSDAKALIANSLEDLYVDLFFHEGEKVKEVTLTIESEINGKIDSVLDTSYEEVVCKILTHASNPRVLSFIRTQLKSNSEVKIFVSKYIVRFLTFLDRTLQTNRSSEREVRMAYGSIPHILHMLGSEGVTAQRVKIIATLKSGTFEHQKDFTEPLLFAWHHFLHIVNLSVIGPYLPTIFATLFPFLESHPKFVSSIFHYLVVSNRSMFENFIPELLFVQRIQIPEMRETLQSIEECLASSLSEPWKSQTKQVLQMVNSEEFLIRRHALDRLRLILKNHSSDLLESVLKSDEADPLMVQITDCLLKNLSHNDLSIRVACGVCLGELGAIDPARKGQSLVSVNVCKVSAYDPKSNDFIMMCTNEMLKALQSSNDSVSYSYFSKAIRQLLNTIFPEKTGQEKIKAFLNGFPPLARGILEPLCNTRNTVKVGDIDTFKLPHPIFGSNLGNTISDWAYHWSVKLITFLVDPVDKNIFISCASCMKADIKLVLILLPYLLLNVLLTCTPCNRSLVEEEMKTVLRWSVFNQSSNKSYLSRTIGRCRGVNTPVFYKAGVDQSKCIATIFDLLDFLERFVTSTKMSKTSDNPSSRSLEGFLKKFPEKVLASKAYMQEDYYRSLLYFEKHLRNKDDSIKCLHPLRNIYSKLNDTDGLLGVTVSWEEMAGTESLVLNHWVQGNIEDALVGYRHLSQTQGSTHHYRGMIMCYLSLDQPFVAAQVCRTVLDQGLTDFSFSNEMAEVLWHLLAMEELDSLLSRLDQSLKKSWCWGIDLGVAFSSFNHSNFGQLLGKISEIRVHLVEQLWALSNNRLGGYRQSYDHIVKLSVLNEIEKFADLSSQLLSASSNNPEASLNEIIGRWTDLRFQSLQPDHNIKHQVLNIRKTCLSLLKNLAQNKCPSIVPLLEEAVSNNVMLKINLARKSGNLQKAFSLAADAEPLLPLGLFVEKAKLLRAQNRTDEAVLTLKQGVHHYFPDLEILKSQRYSKKLLCAKAKLLIAKYNEESLNVDVIEGIKYYKEAAKVCSWEKSFKCLAQYQYKIITSDCNPDSSVEKAELQLEAAKYFGKSLLYGSQFIYQSMPCMLSLWLDFAARLVYDTGNPTRAVITEQRRTIMNQFTTTMSKYVSKLPSYMFMTAFSQLLSRIGHPHRPSFEVLKEIIINIMVSFPQQALWMFVSTHNSPIKEHKSRAEEIFKSPVILKNSYLQEFINVFLKLTSKLIALTVKQVPPNTKTISIKAVEGLPSILKMSPGIMIPAQKFRTISLPNYKHFEQNFSISSHNPFPSNLVYMCDVKDEVQVLHSMQKPKKVTFIGSDGKEYSLLCKPMDDLRLDSRVMEFNSIVNMYLRRDGEARQRDLHIRTYSVVPLNHNTGIIEWLENLDSYRHVVLKLYSQENMLMSAREIKFCTTSVRDSLERKKSIFVTKLLSRHPPIFYEWFHQQFPDAESWYTARQNYVRTTAVMSMIGYIVGLGDRHGENVLLDSQTGELVHVDFNCLFNKGEKLEYPEVVPFRLTHNMVSAMGPTGTEGSFLRACIETTRVMRNQTDQLLSVIKPFVYDREKAKTRLEQGEYTNDGAVNHISNVSKRLKGIVKTMSKNTQPLSVEGQVRMLIAEATSIDNLCQMFMGWAPYL